jgi:two-component system, LytTR family, sensor kinase
MNRIALHIAFWLLYLSFTVAIYYVKEPDLGLHIAYELASLPAKLICVYFTLYFILPRFLLKKKYWKAVILIILVLTLGVFFLQLLVINTVYPAYFPGITNSVFQNNPSKFISPLLDLIIVTTMAVALKLLKSREKEERDRLSLEKTNIQNELQLLKSQLQPHFLFNTLNGLYALIRDKPELASQMVIRLSNLLRYIIYEGRNALVSVAEDLGCIENYLELERVRYGSKLRLDFSVSGETGSKKIPPLLLLPFIENSFKHGVSNDYNSCWIRCAIIVSENTLEMDLKNSMAKFPGDTTEKPGIGIKNVRQLLDYSYQGRYTLSTRKADEVYHVTLKIPVSNS